MLLGCASAWLTGCGHDAAATDADATAGTGAPADTAARAGEAAALLRSEDTAAEAARIAAEIAAENEEKARMAEANAQFRESDHPQVTFTTSLGDFVLELDREKAPVTTENFVQYVVDGHYDGLIAHRVIKDFMVQMGGYDAEMNQRPTRAGIRNESDNGLKNDRGTISMARTNDPDSATSQFFINTVDNDYLNAQAGRPGYAVFGKVVEGMETVDAIESTETGRVGPFQDVPTETIVIEHARLTGG